jgi:hypothetical protein
VEGLHTIDDFHKKISTNSMLILHAVLSTCLKFIRITCVYCMYVLLSLSHESVYEQNVYIC